MKKCCSKYLKSHQERVRPQSLSVRQDACGRQSLCQPRAALKPGDLRELRCLVVRVLEGVWDHGSGDVTRSIEDWPKPRAPATMPVPMSPIMDGVSSVGSRVGMVSTGGAASTAGCSVTYLSNGLLVVGMGKVSWATSVAVRKVCRW
jgi:hypothetical protein